MPNRLQFSLGKLTGFVCLCALCFGCMRFFPIPAMLWVPFFLVLWLGITLRSAVARVGCLGFLVGAGTETLLEFPVTRFVIEQTAWLGLFQNFSGGVFSYIFPLAICLNGGVASWLFIVAYRAIQKTPIVRLYLTLKAINVAFFCLTVLLLAASITYACLRARH